MFGGQVYSGVLVKFGNVPWKIWHGRRLRDGSLFTLGIQGLRRILPVALLLRSLLAKSRRRDATRSGRCGRTEVENFVSPGIIHAPGFQLRIPASLNVLRAFSPRVLRRMAEIERVRRGTRRRRPRADVVVSISPLSSAADGREASGRARERRAGRERFRAVSRFLRRWT